MCKETAFIGNPKKNVLTDHTSQHVSAMLFCFLPQLNLLDATLNDEKTEEDWGAWSFNMVSKHGNKFSAVLQKKYCRIVWSNKKRERSVDIRDSLQQFIKDIFQQIVETDIFSCHAESSFREKTASTTNNRLAASKQFFLSFKSK